MSEPARVLVIGDDALLDRVEEALTARGAACTVHRAKGPKEASLVLEDHEVDAVLAWYDPEEDEDARGLLEAGGRVPEVPRVLVAPRLDTAIAQETIRAGVDDLLPSDGDEDTAKLLASRLLELVEGYREEQHLVCLQRIDELIRRVYRALVRADSQQETDEEVCRILAGSDPFVFAWIGEIDERVDVVRPRASAGVSERYLKQVVITTREEPMGEGPTGRAVRTRELQVMEDIPNDPRYEPWREAALEQGYRSSAAVPLVHDDELFGVLNVYADRHGAFGEQERAMLEDLGGSVAFALANARAREQLERSQRYTERILNSLPDGIYVIDTDGHLRLWNRAVEEITGYEPEELSTMHVSDFVPEDESERISEAIEDTFEEGPVRVVSRVQTHDGREIPYEFYSAATTDLDGDPVVVGVARDVTDRQEREERLERQRGQLEVLNRLVRHDIKNDMMVVVGLTEMLMDEVQGEVRTELERVHETGKHTMQLTEVARDLVEIVIQGGELGVEPTSLAEHLQTEIDNASRSYADATYTTKGSIPDVQVEANQLLGAVFRNLLNNAAQHNDRDHPQITIRAEANEEQVQVAITDDGPGIPEDRKAQLFERSPELEAGGTSLGLFLVGRLLDIYGGEIELEENEPRGTVAIVTLNRYRSSR